MAETTKPEPPADKARMLAELVSKAFRADDAAAMRLFGSNAAAFLARDVEYERSQASALEAQRPRLSFDVLARVQFFLFLIVRDELASEDKIEELQREHVDKVERAGGGYYDEASLELAAWAQGAALRLLGVHVGTVASTLNELEAVDRALERARQKAHEPSEVGLLLNALHVDRPWPASDVLERLANAAEHLLDRHGCDAHGYEEVGRAALEARAIANELRQAIARVGGVARVVHAPAVAAWLEGRAPYPAPKVDACRPADEECTQADRASCDVPQHRTDELERSAKAFGPVAFDLEHALREAAARIARMVASAEGEPFVGAIYHELLYRVPKLCALLPGPWSTLERELGQDVGKAFVDRSRSSLSAVSLHLLRDSSGRVSAAWIEPPALLQLPPRRP